MVQWDEIGVKVEEVKEEMEVEVELLWRDLQSAMGVEGKLQVADDDGGDAMIGEEWTEDGMD